MLEIKNEFLSVEVDIKGAQLTHVINNSTGFDYIWNGDAWPKHAPILFPSIGRSTNDEYLVGDVKYPMPQHGFVSDYDFEIVKKQDDELTLSFSSNNETFQSYPFCFTLTVSYKLENNQLLVNFEVQNNSDCSLSYALGFHPAFKLKQDFESHALEVSPSYSQLEQYEIVKNPYPYRSGKIKNFKVEGSKFALKHALFEEGLVIITNKINEVSLQGLGYEVKMNLEDFSNLCLWTKEDKELSFLCMEPFVGLPDKINEVQEINKKEMNAHLNARDHAHYKVTLSFD
ncbi:aldose 1-epimerase family protein [Lactococcus hircilactis]|uniref:Aldose 1-epimerase family protein n=1 Tax=Lactococcus hircilactis TaxID=1494462 RepID=A0A7X1ZA92_9LACT|nr:aldose 1-epimerase family protein [Lactococcus hircilactis]MQW40736.1 aldose 1-epimerase family protein [Lactococcus hircilactis]